MTDSERKKAVADIIKGMRTRRGLTMKELADRAGISASAISIYEAGKARPTAENLLKLVEAADYVLLFRPKESVEKDKKYYRKFNK